jgi:hypothetical protein
VLLPALCIVSATETAMFFSNFTFRQNGLSGLVKSVIGTSPVCCTFLLIWIKLGGEIYCVAMSFLSRGTVQGNYNSL